MLKQNSLLALLLLALFQNAIAGSISLYVTVRQLKSFLVVTINDPDGYFLEGATIEVLKENKIIGTKTTNTQGRAVIEIEPGMYDIRLKASGFAPSFLKGFKITPGENTIFITLSPLVKKEDVITYPSPCKDRVTFLYFLKSPSLVKIRVYNIALELVAEIEEEKEAGYQRTIWDISRVAQGVYMYQIEARVKATGEKIEFPIKKLAIVK